MKKNCYPELVKAFSTYSHDPEWGHVWPGKYVIKFPGDPNEYVMEAWAPWKITTMETKHPDGTRKAEKIHFVPDGINWTAHMCNLESRALKIANGGHNSLPIIKVRDTPNWKIALYRKLAKIGKGDKVFTYYKDNRIGVIYY